MAVGRGLVHLAGSGVALELVKGARTALVTLSLAMRRETLCVAIVVSARSEAETDAGSSRSERRSQVENAPNRPRNVVVSAR